MIDDVQWTLKSDRNNRDSLNNQNLKKKLLLYKTLEFSSLGKVHTTFQS